jgi:hypothetical protein
VVRVCGSCERLECDAQVQAGWGAVDGPGSGAATITINVIRSTHSDSPLIKKNTARFSPSAAVRPGHLTLIEFFG